MKTIKLKELIRVVKPEYVFLKLTPNNSIRNNSTHKIAKSISSLYRNITQNIKADEVKVLNFMKKDFFFGTKYRFEINSKVAYYIYMEKKKIEFYFIIPKQHLSLIKEKISDSWTNITLSEVNDIPRFSESSTKYQLVYQKEDALSLATDRRNDDLLRSNLNVVDVMEEGDRVGIFYNFIPSTQFSWRSTYENTIRKVKRNLPVDRNKVGVSYLLKSAVGIISGVLDDIGEALSGSTNKKKGNEFNALEGLIEALNGGKKISACTIRKSTATILNSQIVVMSESKDKLRQMNNARSLAQSFETITEDNRLVAKSLKKPVNFTDYSIGAEVNKIGDEEAQNFISIAGRDLLEKYNFIEKVETQETEVPEDLRKGKIRIGEVTYRGQKKQAFLSTHKEFQQLALVVIGPNGSGKSTLFGNIAHDCLKAGECVVIFDYIKNCELSEEVATLFSPDKVLRIECNDVKKIQGFGYNEIKFSSDPEQQYINAKKQTTQLITLINSINTDDDPLSARMNRFLTSAALIVFINGGPIRDVFGVLQNYTKRHEYLMKLPEEQKENMDEYIGYLFELNNYNKNGELLGTKLNLIEGIISRLNKLKDNPYLEKMLRKDTKNNLDLVEEFQKNQLITIKMPETMFATDGERDLYTTYWITKVWLALQERGERIPDRDKLTKVNFIIDELYQVRNTERVLKEKLSRLRKFGLKPIISCHYLGQIYQIREELKSASASYMLLAGCQKNNFIELKEELHPFQLEDLLNLKTHHSLNLIKNKDGYGKFVTKLPAPVGTDKSSKEVMPV
jgi:energy-coupling factor transporter ATP-binding protein EcfA2